MRNVLDAWDDAREHCQDRHPAHLERSCHRSLDADYSLDRRRDLRASDHDQKLAVRAAIPEVLPDRHPDLNLAWAVNRGRTIVGRKQWMWAARAWVPGVAAQCRQGAGRSAA